MATLNPKNQARVMPLPIPGRDTAAPDAAATAASAATPPADPTEQWLNDHPHGESFSDAAADTTTSQTDDATAAAASQPVDAGAPPQTQDPADVAATSDAAPAQAAATTEATPPAATAAAEAGDKTPVHGTAPKPADATAQPAPAEPLRLALEGQYLIADGSQPWTGAQVIEALRERAALEPQAAEARGFKEFFGADLARTKEAWTPLIDSLRAHPDRIGFLEQALQSMDDAKFAYLQESAAYWDREQGVTPATQAQPQAQPAQPQYAQLSPEDKKRLEHFERYTAEREAERQWNAALVEFPVLKDRADLRNSLIELFNAMYQRDPSTTLEDALRVNRPMYQAIVVALGQNESPQPTVQPVVPALNGSPGAAPGGTRSRATATPKKFGNLDDGVEDWLRSHPS